jgi:hypothetical protein
MENHRGLAVRGGPTLQVSLPVLTVSSVSIL